MSSVEERDGAVYLRVRVQPKASRDALRVEADGRIRVTLTAPPLAGRANKALTAFVAKTFQLPKRAVTLVQGEKSREKTLRLDGVTASAVRARCGAARGA